MEVLRRLKKVTWLTLFIMLFSSSSLFSDNLLITRSFSGIWDMPDHESQGIILQIGEQDDGEGGDKKVGVAYWFTYGEDLQTSWYLGVGPVEGNEIPMTLYAASNIGFMAENLEGNANVKDVGTLNLVFHNCNQGHATFDAPEESIGSGEFRIKRINSIYHDRCSGGISDDTPSDAKPLKLEVWLHSARDGYNGKGKAKFWERVDRSDFEVEAEEVPDGTYTLRVCDVVEGEMVVENGEGEGEVEFEFSSPLKDDKPLLSFNPRNCLIELLDGDGVFLTSGDEVLSEK
jgi:hypothetical protein